MKYHVVFFLCCSLVYTTQRLRGELVQHSILPENNLSELSSKVSSLSEKVGLTLKASETRSYEIVRKIKRNQLEFVEGLSFISDNTLLESTGLEGHSEVHYLNLDDMTIGNSMKFSKEIFGEGCSLVNKNGKEKVFVMTYKNGIVYEIDNQLKKVKRTLDLPIEMKEGWGMTKLDENTLLTTDGSNQIFHINPDDFTVKKSVKVYYQDGKPANQLNEIEMIDGLAYMNIFLKNKIVVVDPHSGQMKEVLNFQGLVDYLESDSKYEGYTKGMNMNNCLNGIAYNSKTKQLLVTGKKWPYIYEIKLSQKNSNKN